MNFATVSTAELDNAPSSARDTENFGIVEMLHDGTVKDYNNWQSNFTGMKKDAVLGKHFFSQVAPCTNNFMVSQKYSDSDTLDESMDYTFTVKMLPTPVKLRLLKGVKSQYLLCDR